MKWLFILCIAVLLLMNHANAEERRRLNASRTNKARRAHAATQALRAKQDRRIRQQQTARPQSLAAAAVEGEQSAPPAHGRYLPHLAQGQGWMTFLDVINTCQAPIAYEVDFVGNLGQPYQFEFSDGERYSGITSGDDLLGNSIDSFQLVDTGQELLQGAGVVTEDGGGCVAIETFYVQTREDEEGDEYRLYATVPLQRMEGHGSVLTFFNVGNCDTAMALTSTGGTVRIEAFGPEGQSFGSTDLHNLHHEAFSIGQRFPRSRDQWGMLRISGGAAVVGMDFCSGDLMQFRLAHLGPMEREAVFDPPDDELPRGSRFVVEALKIKLVDHCRTCGIYGTEQYTYGIQLKYLNPTTRKQVYSARIEFRDSDGFQVKKMLFIPDETNYDGRIPITCWTGTGCEFHLPVPAGQSREFSGSIGLQGSEGERVDLSKTKLLTTVE